jgi:hypothetical protein
MKSLSLRNMKPSVRVDAAASTCTSLDHIYPRSKFGTPCYCGARVWGGKTKTAKPNGDSDTSVGIASPTGKSNGDAVGTTSPTGMHVAMGSVGAVAVSGAVGAVAVTGVHDASKEISDTQEKTLDNDSHDGGESSVTTAPPMNAVTETSDTQETHMTLTLKGTSKSKYANDAIYEGAARAIHIPLACFANETAPATLSDFSVLVAAAPKLTAEERKAARKAAPKPTLAEKIEKRRAALAKLEAKLAAPSAAAPSA